MKNHLLSFLRCEEKDISFDHRILADDLALHCTSATVQMLFASRVRKMSNFDAESLRIVLFKGLRSRHGSPKNFSFAKYDEAYRYIFETFVGRDLNRNDVLCMIEFFKAYDLEIIQNLGEECKKTGKFSIPYLARVLQNEAAGLVEEMRQNFRIEQKIAEAPKLVLPSVRPKNFSEKIEKLSEERRIDDFLKGT